MNIDRKSLIYTNNHSLSLAIQWTLLVAFCIALLGVFAKELLTYLPLSITALSRSLIPFLILLIFISPLSLSLKPNWHLHALRGLAIAISNYALLVYLSRVSLFDAILLFNTGPLFLPFLSRFLLHRPLRFRVIISTLVGFIGVAIAIKPDHGVFQWVAIIGLLSGFCNAVSQVFLHKVSQRQCPVENMFCAYFWTSIFLLFPTLYFCLNTTISIAWHWQIVFLLIPLVIISLCNQTMCGFAYQHVRNPASVMPLIYLSIPLLGLFDWVIYRDIPTWNQCFGAALIICSILLLTLMRLRGEHQCRKLH